MGQEPPTKVMRRLYGGLTAKRFVPVPMTSSEARPNIGIGTTRNIACNISGGVYVISQEMVLHIDQQTW